MLKVSGNRNNSTFTSFTKFLSAFKTCLASFLTKAKETMFNYKVNN